MALKKTYIYLKLIILLWMILISLSGQAQILKFDYDEFNTQHGLSQNQVLSIAQDKKGFIWFGSEDGLNRFDGFEFKVYKHKDNDPSSIVSSSVRALLVDDDGSIWIGTNNGICRFYPETEKIKHYPIDFTDETKLSGAYVSSIKKKEDGSIWISYIGSGIDVMFPNTPKVLHYTIHRKDQYALRNDMISSIQFMPDGHTFLGSYAGLVVIGKDGTVLSDEDVKTRFPWSDSVNKTIKTILLTKDGKKLWIGMELDGIFCVDLASNSIKKFDITNSEFTSNNILSICEDSKGDIWIGGDAIYLHDKEADRIKWYNHYGMYIKTHTNAIFQDKDKNIWLGTSRLGIRKFNNEEKEITHYHSNQGEGSIKSDEVLSFNEDNRGQIWIGAGGAGLIKMRKDKKGFEDSPVNHLLNSRVIKSIYKDKQGSFWMGTWDGGLMKYNPENNDLEQYHPKHGNFKSHHVWDIEQDEEGNLWLGTLRDGLCYFSLKTKEYKYFNYKPGDTTALVNNDVLSLFFDSRKILWIGTGNGLSVLFPGSDKFSNLFKFKTNEKLSLSNNVILSIFEDVNGKIWLGTKGGGITIVKVENKRLVVDRVIKESDGIPSNTVSSILADNNNNIWISTMNGLVKLDPNNYSIMEIPPDIALRGIEFLEQASFKLSDGRLLFGSSRGFYVFDPDVLKKKNEDIEVIFTNLKVINDDITPGNKIRGRQILSKAIFETQQLNLSYEDYAFTLTFSSLKYNLQKNIQYSYFLENLDKEWQYNTADKRYIHYTNLSPGKYVLKVRASYDGKHWSENPKKLQITITPPWWNTLWFKVFSILALILTILAIHKLRIRFLENQSRKLEELVLLRTYELDKSNKEIHKLLDEVAIQKDKIEIKNQELQEANEEVGAQRDNLARKSFELEKARFELQKVNVTLEELVEKRTQILNSTLKELETFLYRASHDLQGPISSMRGLISLAKLESNQTKSNTEYNELIESSVLKLEATLKKLLEKHAIQRIRPYFESFSKAEIEELLNTITKGIKCFRPNDFEVNIDESLRLQTDKNLLSLILKNLLDNAFFFSEHAENKKVTLMINPYGDKVVISVQDFGPGIQEGIKDKIFNMFYRGNQLSKGNGLGLYIVKCALNKINGKIELKTTEGVSSNFIVTLDPVDEHSGIGEGMSGLDRY